MNEEICSFCSDTPMQLVLCSSCPRSFCHDCLRKVLNEKELSDVLNDDDGNDWNCMACRQGVKHEIPSLSKSNWVFIDPFMDVSSSKSNQSPHSPKITDNIPISQEQQLSRFKTVTNIDDTQQQNDVRLTSSHEMTAKCDEDCLIEFDNTPVVGKRKYNTRKARNAGTSSAPPPIIDDEVFYFGQYLKYYDNISCSHSKTRNTDDSCYLCKGKHL